MYSYKKALPYLLPALGVIGTIVLDVLFQLLASWHPSSGALAAILATETPALMALGDMARAALKSLETPAYPLPAAAPAAYTAPAYGPHTHAIYIPPLHEIPAAQPHTETVPAAPVEQVIGVATPGGTQYHLTINVPPAS